MADKTYKEPLYKFNASYRYKGPGLEHGPDSVGCEELQTAYEAGFKDGAKWSKSVKDGL